ncbi:MAG: hypothetical protein EG823_06145 [Actinobacteria bacterium]|nr:hypothetical protein [Actinomycetota bacterium]
MPSGRATDHFAVLVGTTVLIVGLVFLLTQTLGLRVVAVGWPVLVIAPGLLILASAYSVPPGRGMSYLAVPGMVVLVAGAVLQVQAITGDWQSWSYAWALVAPGAVGLGLLAAGIREKNRGVRIVGAVLTAGGVAFFVIAEWLLVRVFGVGGAGLGRGFGMVLPAGAVATGLWLLVRGLVRSR